MNPNLQSTRHHHFQHPIKISKTQTNQNQTFRREHARPTQDHQPRAHNVFRKAVIRTQAGARAHPADFPGARSTRQFAEDVGSTYLPGEYVYTHSSRRKGRTSSRMHAEDKANAPRYISPFCQGSRLIAPLRSPGDRPAARRSKESRMYCDDDVGVYFMGS